MTETLAKMSKQTPRITINVSAEEFDMIHQLAFRCGASVSEISKLALLRLVNEAEKGTIPLLPEYRRGIDPGHA